MENSSPPSEAEALVEQIGYWSKRTSDDLSREHYTTHDCPASDLISTAREAASLIERLAAERDSWRVPSDNLVESRKQNASLRTEVERLQEQTERTKELRYFGSNLAATVALGFPTDESVNVGWIDPYAWWDDVREKVKRYIEAERALDAGTTPAGEDARSGLPAQSAGDVGRDGADLTDERSAE